MVRTLPSNANGAGSIPGQGAKIPHAPWPESQNRSRIVTDSIKTIKFLKRQITHTDTQSYYFLK